MNSEFSKFCPENLVSLEKLLIDFRKISNDLNDTSGYKQKAHQLVREAACGMLSLRRSYPRFLKSDWEWISESSVLHQKEANKFLFGCILECQAGKIDIWDNAAFFIEEILSDPDNVWAVITGYSKEEWDDLFDEFNLHKDLAVHSRIWNVAARMIRFYTGDAGKIWEGYEDQPSEVLKRLLILQIPLSTATLVTGALKDEHYLSGRLDIVGDVVDSRVIGRVLCGIFGGLSSHEAILLARMVSPSDPWNLDRPLYVTGMSTCGPGPRCRSCVLNETCLYAVSEKFEIPLGSQIYKAIFEEKVRSGQTTLKRWQS